MARTDVRWRIGSISFAYKDWRGPFYPPEVKPPDYLTYYARQFDTIELDTTFHAVPPPDRVAKWADATGDDFRFILKIPKAISHEPGLADRAGDLIDFANVVRPMGEKLALALLQLPPTAGSEVRDELNRLLDAVGDRLPMAVEVRHASWFNGRALPALAERGVVVVASDHAERVQPILGPSDVVYVRLIGEHERFPVKDQERWDVQERLEWWVRQIEEKVSPGGTAFVTATNDYAGFSPATARRLRAIVGLPDTTPRQGPTSLFE